MSQFQFLHSGLLKKMTTYVIVLSIFFNSIGLVFGEAESDVEGRIEEYCKKVVGENWENFEVTLFTDDYKKKNYLQIKEEYHKDMNTLFADAIQAMLETIDEEQDLSRVCSEESITKKMQTSVTTYELSQKTLCRYALYQATLKARNDYIISEDIQNKDIQSVMGGSLNSKMDIYKGLQLFQEQIESELAIAKISLETTLEAYNEMLIMYPLHLRLRCIIGDLLIFRNELSQLVDIFFCLDRFIDAASDTLN